MKISLVAAVLLFASVAWGQSYPTMTPSNTQLVFANPDGSALALGQEAEASVTFTISNGPITFKDTRDTYCIPKPGGKEYMAECDDVTMDSGCVGTWQSGDTCTITYTYVADGDDNLCNLNNPGNENHPPGPAYPDGCEGTIRVKVPNNPNFVLIDYSVATTVVLPK
jgi:hypothetical protein